MEEIENLEIREEIPERWDTIMKRYAYNVAVVFCYVVKDGQVLLITRGKPPSYKEVTVIGGKKEPGEDLFSACNREVLEETNLVLEDAVFRGVVNIRMEGHDFETMAFYFEGDRFSGELKSCEEGDLEWCPIEESFRKEGVSEFYLRISPFVFRKGECFSGSILVDGQGRIRNVDIR
jgi:8-oxo-dGTP diphosphatase